MKVGALFPQTEIGSEPSAIRDYALALEAQGFEFLSAFDHVLGASPERPGGWTKPYTHRDPFHEVFVLFGFLAACTTKIELVTEVLVLPQRQAALVAKQAAEVDVLSGGRLRLGVGIGWNEVEFEAMGMSFRDRGRRAEEQILVLRQLWAAEVVDYDGRYHRIDAAGINPLPVRRAIPIWMGGKADSALRRMARLADGWMSNLPVGTELEDTLTRLRRYVAEAGRDWQDFGIAGRVTLGEGIENAIREACAWQQLGATHLSVSTMDIGLADCASHIERLTQFREAWENR